jgi:hypothetical protein
MKAAGSDRGSQGGLMPIPHGDPLGVDILAKVLCLAGVLERIEHDLE